ncbi:hypothetical protein JTB14_034601 [Gonioctena quinquepunctata]|nr:hypothetical protein JTB14_034601 [Gonioctena quinquepunctata]
MAFQCPSSPDCCQPRNAPRQEQTNQEPPHCWGGDCRLPPPRVENWEPYYEEEAQSANCCRRCCNLFSCCVTEYELNASSASPGVLPLCDQAGVKWPTDVQMPPSVLTINLTTPVSRDAILHAMLHAIFHAIPHAILHARDSQSVRVVPVRVVPVRVVPVGVILAGVVPAGYHHHVGNLIIKPLRGTTVAKDAVLFFVVV